MESLHVACRRPRCAWRGTSGEFESHHCPLEVHEISHIAEFQELLSCDERLYIKIRVLEEISVKIVNVRNLEVNDDYLSLVCETMHRYPIYCEIQLICLEILQRVSETPKGMMYIIRSYDVIVGDLERLCSKQPLKDVAKKLLDTLTNARAEYDAVSAFANHLLKGKR